MQPSGLATLTQLRRFGTGRALWIRFGTFLRIIRDKYWRAPISCPVPDEQDTVSLCLYEHLCETPDSLSVSRGRNHSQYQSSWSSLVLALPPEIPSPTAGNTMSQRMAHWHEEHGQHHAVKHTAQTLTHCPCFPNICSTLLAKVVNWANFRYVTTGKQGCHLHHVRSCQSLKVGQGEKYWKIWRTGEWWNFWFYQSIPGTQRQVAALTRSSFIIHSASHLSATSVRPSWITKLSRYTDYGLMLNLSSPGGLRWGESQWICEINSVGRRHESRAKSKGQSEFNPVTEHVPNVNQIIKQYEPRQNPTLAPCYCRYVSVIQKWNRQHLINTFNWTSHKTVNMYKKLCVRLVLLLFRF